VQIAAKKEITLNIGLFTDSYLPEVSGLVTSIQTLKKALETRGHNVYVFTTTNPESAPNPRVMRLPSMPLIFMKERRFGVFYTPRASYAVKKLKLDIIHTHTEFSLGIFGKLMARSLQIPIVHTYHTMYKDYMHYISKGHMVGLTNEIARSFSKTYCEGCEMIVAPSQKVVNTLKEYGVTRPIRIIPTGIEINRFKQVRSNPQARIEMRDKYGIDSRTPLIISLGRVSKEKSLEMIIQAMPGVLEKVPDARLLIVGDGPARESLQELADSILKPDKVLFAGERPWDEVPGFYRCGDAFVSASVTETQGLTLIEAMASGLPVIARVDLSHQSMISHGENGLLFDNTEELTSCLVRVLQNETFSKELVATSDELVKRFSAENFGFEIESFYNEALGKYSKEKHKYVKAIQWATFMEKTIMRPLSVNPGKIIRKNVPLRFLKRFRK
jgi:1,2-diacylglycerol 3-alpha-glucosyltransferase